jgi:hypothetical protein
VNKTEEKRTLVCPNKACGKVFDNPLKTLKIHQGLEEHYKACPYCLTEITITEMEGENPPEETLSEPIFSNYESSKKEEKDFTCAHYAGYMSEKEHRLQIPEECMVCKDVIDCMNRKPIT